ncbi:MAG: [FeFe] hydrogenase H-cluster radical SAM maturase HydE [Oscillospiraceae bacterium]
MEFTRNELIEIIDENNLKISRELQSRAFSIREKFYGRSVYVRGLIEFSNYCRNDCYYCGIRCSNKNAKRYRLSKSEILECCETGNSLGFKTFVLQGGEDLYYDDKCMCDIIYAIKTSFPKVAITLSIGERSHESYKSYFEAGADRFLLRHETATASHYALLHPPNLTLENRKKCLYDLKEIGYQVGAGFMVGSPYQTAENLADDLLFLEELQPHMVGIGPFIPHIDTQFKNEKAGDLNLTLKMLSITRIILPQVLLPATTALGTIAKDGRERGFRAGANVVMPNLSPSAVRNAYSLYDNKLCTGDEAAESIKHLEKSIESEGFKLDFSRGDSKMTLKSTLNGG